MRSYSPERRTPVRPGAVSNGQGRALRPPRCAHKQSHAERTATAATAASPNSIALAPKRSCSTPSTVIIKAMGMLETEDSRLNLVAAAPWPIASSTAAE